MGLLTNNFEILVWLQLHSHEGAQILAWPRALRKVNPDLTADKLRQLLLLIITKQNYIYLSYPSTIRLRHFCSISAYSNSKCYCHVCTLQILDVAVQSGRLVSIEITGFQLPAPVQVTATQQGGMLQQLTGMRTGAGFQQVGGGMYIGFYYVAY